MNMNRIIYVKNKTADYVGQKAKMVKTVAAGIRSKAAVFLFDAKYELKGLMYNAYDKVRFFAAEHMDGNEDVIKYNGRFKPKKKGMIKAFAVSQLKRVKAKMPKSLPEAGTSAKYMFAHCAKIVKSAFLISKYNVSRVVRNAVEYLAEVKVSTYAGLGGIAVGGFAVTLIITTIVSSYAMGVTINGERVGFVESEKELAVMVEDVEKELSAENNNANVQVNEDLIEVDSMAKSKDEVIMMDEGKLKETVVNANAVTATASAITVNGKPVLYVGTRDDAKFVLNSIKQKYIVSGEDVIAGFKEDVSIADASVNASDVMPSSTAITYLLTGNESIEKYKVKEDDTDWDIAKAHGLTEKELQKANPQLDTKVIKKGDVVNISKMVPFVHMEVVATVNVKEKINYKTKKVETSDLYVGETKVEKEGKRGEASIIKRSVYVNGKEESFQLIRKDVIKKATKKVVLVGTKEKASEVSSSSGSSSYSSGGGDSYISGSGSLSNPMRNMQLSSPFGNRWGRMHTGADFRNPAGTPIYAAAGGTVTSSGYDGAYGNVVRISHGGGMTTVYAHCNSLNVRSGQSVSKGQQIATVGRTGRATGNHLHFEVRINGTPKNPLNYL